MVFSFFRKKDTDVEDGPKAAHPSAVAGEVSAFGHDSGAGIEVGGSDSNLSPAEEQAVVLYANGETADAVLALQAELPEIRGLRRLESWLLLFELYQQQNDRAALTSWRWSSSSNSKKRRRCGASGRPRRSGRSSPRATVALSVPA